MACMTSRFGGSCRFKLPALLLLVQFSRQRWPQLRSFGSFGSVFHSGRMCYNQCKAMTLASTSATLLDPTPPITASSSQLPVLARRTVLPVPKSALQGVWKFLPWSKDGTPEVCIISKVATTYQLNSCLLVCETLSFLKALTRHHIVLLMNRHQGPRLSVRIEVLDGKCLEARPELSI